jgi:hypothetical protein
VEGSIPSRVAIARCLFAPRCPYCASEVSSVLFLAFPSCPVEK